MPFVYEVPIFKRLGKHLPLYIMTDLYHISIISSLITVGSRLIKSLSDLLLTCRTYIAHDPMYQFWKQKQTTQQVYKNGLFIYKVVDPVVFFKTVDRY